MKRKEHSYICSNPKLLYFYLGALMAKPENDVTVPEKLTWGTWEELLLACAVHRHGTESWSSVSAEIRKRSPKLCSITASACRYKYFDLKRRFTRNLALSRSGEVESNVSWLEELRKLRVDELRREVELYDLSISSLQSKVKRLEEERDMSFDEVKTEIENLDLDKIEETDELRRKSELNGSISPDPEEDCRVTESENPKKDVEIGLRDGVEANLVDEDSCKGSCESLEKESAAKSERAEPGRETKLIESMAESKQEGKESSDVQSSASLPRKGTSEQDNEDQSRSTEVFNVESQPSISFIEILLSHPCGSYFSRRLESQVTEEYGNIIKQHIDFEIIRKRSEGGLYKSSRNKFFRDLLLLINNARVFYPKGTSEFKSAEQLNQLVKKQLNTLMRPKEKSLELVTAVSSKPRMSVPIIACQDRSSLADKPLLLPLGADKKSKKTVDDGDDDDVSLFLEKLTRVRTYSAKKVENRNVKDRDSSLNADDINEVKKTESNKNGSSKKKSAASFLKRIRVGSSSEADVETLNSTTGKGGVEQSKHNSNKDDGKKLAKTGKNQTSEKGSPVKKNNNGRVLKTEASPSSILAKRRRESGEKVTVSSFSTRLKKRVRR